MTRRAHSFRLDDVLWATLAGEAKRQGVTVTDVVTAALERYVLDTGVPPAGVLTLTAQLDGIMTESRRAELVAGGDDAFYEMSDADREFAREQFAKGAACLHCGGLHLRACPRVRRLGWRNKEDLAEVEYWPDGKWPRDDIIFPEDIFESGESPKVTAQSHTPNGDIPDSPLYYQQEAQ